MLPEELPRSLTYVREERVRSGRTDTMPQPWRRTSIWQDTFTYIDLNTVRAGVVEHPSGYKVSGYNEIQKPPQRCAIIDIKALQNIFAIDNQEQFQREHRQWVESELKVRANTRKVLWSESIAVGSEKFVNEIRQQLGLRVRGRSVVSGEVGFALKEAESAYYTLLEGTMGLLRLTNCYSWRINDENTR
jgi:REP-associated tyrosine transposase